MYVYLKIKTIYELLLRNKNPENKRIFKTENKLFLRIMPMLLITECLLTASYVHCQCTHYTLTFVY